MIIGDHLRLFRGLFVVIILLIAMNGLHAAVYSISDFTARYPLTNVVYFILAFWISFILVFFTLGLWVFPRNGAGSFKTNCWILCDRRVVFLLIISSALGVLLTGFAKLTVLFDSNSVCLSSIRFVWANVDKNTLSPVLRVSSSLGHILSFFAVPGLIISGIRFITYNSFKSLVAGFYFLVFLTLGLCYSGLIGARNPILTMFVFAVFPIFFLIVTNRFDRSKIVRSVFLVLLSFLFAIIFVVSVTNDRVTNCQVSFNPEYLDSFSHELAVDVNQDAGVDSQHMVGQTLALYLNHSLFNFAQVVYSRSNSSGVIIRKTLWPLERLGLYKIDHDSNRVYGAGGLGLIGVIYHDFGVFGVVFGGVIFGLVFLCTLALFYFDNIDVGVPLFFSSILFYAISLSNIFYVPSLMVFPFVILACFTSFVAPTLIKFILRKG